MLLSPHARKLALTAHVVASVGWLGSVAAFLALALTGLRSENAETVRAVYVSAEIVTWRVILPLCAAALITGLIQGLGTSWGLVRHYWVLIKLLLTIGATLLLLLHTGPIRVLAEAASAGPLPSHLDRTRLQLVVDATLAVGALLVASVLSIYKPTGLTPYGWRRAQRDA
jgi:uncharacterized membrane protein